MNRGVSLIAAVVWIVGCGRDADPGPSPTTANPVVETSPHPVPKSQAKADVPKPEAPTPAKAKPMAIFKTEAGPVAVQLEVVSTRPKISQGLMYREHLAPDHGMLFVFSSEQVRSFWMKNTLISLDMLFIRKDLTVAGVVRNTTTLSKESRSIGIPTQYVIEVNAGFTKANGIDAGTKVVLENLPRIDNAPP